MNLTGEARLTQLIELVGGLPDYHLRTLYFLIQHLARVVDHEQKNRVRLADEEK